MLKFQLVYINDCKPLFYRGALFLAVPNRLFLYDNLFSTFVLIQKWSKKSRPSQCAPRAWAGPTHNRYSKLAATFHCPAHSFVILYGSLLVGWFPNFFRAAIGRCCSPASRRGGLFL